MTPDLRQLCQSLTGHRVRVAFTNGLAREGILTDYNEKELNIQSDIGGSPRTYKIEADYIAEMREAPMTDHPQYGQHLAPGAQLPPKPAAVPATPKPAEPLDLAWARRCAQDYQANPTDARARNAAQCLPGLLAAYDAIAARAADLDSRLRFAGVVWPAELCHATTDATTDGARLVCFLALGHTGDHTTNAWPNNRTWPKTPQELYDQAAPELCPGYPQTRPEDSRLACFRPAGHAGEHSNTPTWGRVGLDPCPARSHQQESCTKGYMHSGGHKWGPTRPIEAGPELPEAESRCARTRTDPLHGVLTCEKVAGHTKRHLTTTGTDGTLEWSDLDPPNPLELEAGPELPDERKACPDFCVANHHKPLTPDEGPELPEQAPGHAPGCNGIPQLGDAGYCPCGKTQSWAANCRCVIGHQPATEAPSPTAEAPERAAEPLTGASE